jgi:hypothetical protein
VVLGIAYLNDFGELNPDTAIKSAFALGSTGKSIKIPVPFY